MATKKKATARPLQSRNEVSSILERVTRAEERVMVMDQRQEDWRNETRSAHKELSDRLGSLETALTKYQGAWGAITLILSAIGAALALFHEAILKKLGLSS